MDNLDDLVKKQYNEFPYPSIPVGSREDEVLYSSNYEYVNYLCTGIFKSHKGIRILDAGCGTGFSTLKLAQQNPTASILALDLSACSLKMALERLQKAGIKSDRITFREADLSKPGDLGEPFDYIVSTGVLHHMASPETGLNNLKSNLKADGIMYLMLYSEFGRYFLNQTRRFIGLLREDTGNFSEGIAIGKELLKILPADHPLLLYYQKSYENAVKTIGEEFASSDAQFVDAYLNARERTYNIDQLFEFLETNGLNFLRFLDEPAWELPTLLKGNRILLEKAGKLSAKEGYKLGEIINSQKNFAFFAARQKFTRKYYQDEQLLECKILFSPFNTVEETADQSGRITLKIFSPLGLGIQLGPDALLLYNLMTNHKKIGTILDELIAMGGITREESVAFLLPFIRNMESTGILFFISEN